MNSEAQRKLLIDEQNTMTKSILSAVSAQHLRCWVLLLEGLSQSVTFHHLLYNIPHHSVRIGYV